jgi:fatty-acid peroxygenase
MADLAWRLWRDGYRALPEERARHDGADTFETRLLGRRALVVRGPAGARLFYDTSVIRRYDAIPAPLASLLFGAGAVHGLDDAEHAARKSMFLGLLTPERIAPLVTAVERELARRAARWRGRVVVFDELVEVYGAAVLPWAGIACSRRRAARLARRLARIVDGFGGVPTAYARGWAARIAANRWARRLVESVRIGETIPPAGSVLAVIAGSDLPASVAAVELINVLRPTVAVAWPGTFVAVALAEHRQWRELLGDAQRRVAFAHEVRRRYPFVPALAGRVRRDADALGRHLNAGDRVVLDVVGTDHDPQTWPDPEDFLPSRFARGEPDPYELVPQGGGDARTGHRCPGEPLTVRLLAATAGVLAGVDFAPIDTSYDVTRIPTLPPRGLRVLVSR